MLERWTDHPSTVDPEPFAGPDHPIRRRTRAVADGQPWTIDNARRMAELFDSMAADWSTEHVDETKAAPVLDALERGDVPIDGDWLEIGSGTGAGTRLLAHVVGSLVATDLSAEMLRHAPRELAPRVRSDASSLPFPNGSFDAVLMINMLLFPHEVDRVLRPGGVIVWINTLGDQTPIHLPPDDVLAALPGDWDGRTARAGTGFWLTARRHRGENGECPRVGTQGHSLDS
jgi:SAM-dependent methyltransferase